MIINLTQHAATPDQIAAGVVDLPVDIRAEVARALTFNELPEAEEIENRAFFLANIARKQVILAGGDPETAHVMIGGAPWLMHPLEEALLDAGLWPVYAFSRRESVENVNADGTVTKVNVFRHAGFVSAICE